MSARQKPAIARMYEILEEMVTAAEAGDFKHVLELRRAYDVRKPLSIYMHMEEMLRSDYDNCANSCVTASVFLHLREELVADARQRFDRIPKPKD